MDNRMDSRMEKSIIVYFCSLYPWMSSRCSLCMCSASSGNIARLQAIGGSVRPDDRGWGGLCAVHPQHCCS
jgi:hypothetical protein